MQNFKTVLNKVSNIIYEPNHMKVSYVIEEQQNADYAAGRFALNFDLNNIKTAEIWITQTVRFRAAKTTPIKIGQFVSFWEKNPNNNNQPYHIDSAPDLLIITAFNKEIEFGQFVFPKNMLVEKNILKSHITTGKMGIRVYPSWDKPTNKTAIQTQLWQLDYFFKISNVSMIPIDKILALYAQ